MTKPVINSFSQLAEISIHYYQRYLPTAFNEELTLLQKVNKIIKVLTDMGKLSNDVVTQWNEVMGWVMGEGLDDAVSAKLDQMVQDGTLDEIINVSIFEELNQKINSFLRVTDYAGVDKTGATTSQTGIVQAVQDAFDRGMSLYWESGTYLSTTNIPHLHEVRHLGDGVIKRGTNLFYVNPRTTQINTIYITPVNGVLGNDGLSTNESPLTIKEIFDKLPNYGPVLGGKWVIQLSVGTYVHAYLPDGIQSEDYITIQGVEVGGHPNVPVTMIKDSDNAVGSGLYASYGTRMKVRNIKLQGYKGSSSSQGIAGSYGAEIVTENVHTDNCYYGMRAQQKTKLTVPDGIHSNHQVGLVSLIQCNHYIGNQDAGGDRSKTAIITDCGVGIQIQEFSTGHANYIVIQNCNDGVFLFRTGGVNGNGIQFIGNKRDVRQEHGSSFSATTDVIWSETSDQSIANLDGHLVGNGFIDGVEFAYNISEKIFDIENVNTVYNDTSQKSVVTQILKTPHWKINPSSMTRGKGIKVKIYGELFGTTDVKHIQLRLTDGVAFQTVGYDHSNLEVGRFHAEGVIYFLGSELFMKQHGHSHNNAGKLSTARPTTMNLNNDLTLQVQCYVGNALDSIRIDVVEMSVFG
jgi:hypothetical protein